MLINILIFNKKENPPFKRLINLRRINFFFSLDLSIRVIISLNIIYIFFFFFLILNIVFQKHKIMYKFYNDQTMSIPNFQYFSSTPIYLQRTIYKTKLAMNLSHVKKLITSNNHSMHQTFNHQNYRNSKSFREQFSDESNINFATIIQHQ